MRHAPDILCPLEAEPSCMQQALQALQQLRHFKVQRRFSKEGHMPSMLWGLYYL